MACCTHACLIWSDTEVKWTEVILKNIFSSLKMCRKFKMSWFGVWTYVLLDTEATMKSRNSCFITLRGHVRPQRSNINYRPANKARAITSNLWTINYFQNGPQKWWTLSQKQVILHDDSSYMCDSHIWHI